MKKLKIATATRWKKEKAMDWTPVRRGDAYCSPACGAGPLLCSYVKYQRAVDFSNQVARDLGDGWKPVVFENLGWHARVVSPCGRINISLPVNETSSYGYMAHLGPKENSPAGKWAERGKTPREAIENVLRAARLDLGLIEDCVAGLEVPRIAAAERQGRMTRKMTLLK